MLVTPGYDESVRVERSWSQSPHQAFQAGLDEDDQAVGQGEEVGHPRGVLRVAVLWGDLVVGGDEGAAAVGIARVGPWVYKEVVVVVDREGEIVVVDKGFTCKEVVVVVDREGQGRAAVEVVKDDQEK